MALKGVKLGKRRRSGRKGADSGRRKKKRRKKAKSKASPRPAPSNHTIARLRHQRFLRLSEEWPIFPDSECERFRDWLLTETQLKSLYDKILVEGCTAKIAIESGIDYPSLK